MPWIDTLDNDARAHAASKGWDRLDDAAAAQAILKSYRELERVRPAPPVVPLTPNEYVFDIKHADGAELDPDFIGFVRSTAHELKMPVATAQELAKRLIGYADTAEASVVAATSTALTEGLDKIKNAWGAEFDAKSAVFARGIEALGLEKEAQDALANAMGMDKLMEVGYNLGARMSEAPLLKGTPPVADKAIPMTRGQALEARNKLTSDPEFAKKLMDGNAEAIKQLEDISKAVLGDPNGTWQAPPANFGREHDDQGREKAVDYTRYDVKP